MLMKVKILSCRIFEVYIQELLKQITPEFDFDIEYYEIDQHLYPKKFQKILQTRINEIENVDLILLIYGICGNATKDLEAVHVPIAIPRVHDCATILLGSKSKFNEVFGHRPSQGWSCISYNSDNSHTGEFFTNTNYQEMVERYGEDNAKYLFEVLFPKPEKIVYISFGLPEDQKRIETDDLIGEVQPGSLEFLKRIFKNQFEDLIVVQPGEIIHPVYDFEQVISKKKRR